jgi:hypothetical protein
MMHPLETKTVKFGSTQSQKLPLPGVSASSEVFVSDRPAINQQPLERTRSLGWVVF